MTREDIYERLQNVFRDLFDDDSIELKDSSTAKDIRGWDSLTHITLISEVEDEFDIQFEMKDVSKMKNVGEMVDMIQRLAE